jgi:hypothetical protein
MSCTHDCGCAETVKDARTDEWVQIAPESARAATLTPERPVKAPGQDGDLFLTRGTPVEVEWPRSGNRVPYYVDEGGYQLIAGHVGDRTPLPWGDGRIVRVLTTEDKPTQEPVLPRRIKPEDVRVGMIIEQRNGVCIMQGRVVAVEDGVFQCEVAWLRTENERDDWSLWLVEDEPAARGPGRRGGGAHGEGSARQELRRRRLSRLGRSRRVHAQGLAGRRPCRDQEPARPVFRRDAEGRAVSRQPQQRCALCGRVEIEQTGADSHPTRPSVDSSGVPVNVVPLRSEYTAASLLPRRGRAMSRLDEIKARCDAATEGPWVRDMHSPDMSGRSGWYIRGPRKLGPRSMVLNSRMLPGDAEFVEAAREDVPWLIERVQELSGAICWDTTCLNCASLLDSNYDQYMRAEIAEAEVERLTDLCDEFRKREESQVHPRAVDCRGGAARTLEVRGPKS